MLFIYHIYIYIYLFQLKQFNNAQMFAWIDVYMLSGNV